MFKILVADDEQFIRKGIVTILQRNITEPLKIIEAKNGIEAIEKVEKERPNLIITDINMPGIDGLQFIKEIKEKQINTEVLLLSGYSNFEYAKEGISLGVKEYVTKPIDKEEFVTLVNKYISNIKLQKQKELAETEQKQESKKMIEGVKKDFLVSLLTSLNSKEATHYMKQLKELNVDFKPQWYTCVIFQYELNQENLDYIDFAIKNILDEYLPEHCDGFLLNANYHTGRTISIFETNQMGFKDPQKKATIRKTTATLSKIVKVRVSAGIGESTLGFEHLHRGFRQGIEALEFKIFNPGDTVLVYEDIRQGKTLDPPKKLLYESYLEICTEINCISQQGQTKEVLKRLRHLYGQLLSHLTKRIPQKEQEDYKDFGEFWTLDDLKKEIKILLEKLQQTQKENVINVKLMEEIIHFINENITKELDLNIIAEKFNRSPSYISTMFKRYVPGGFNTYVTEKRMNIAKKLLRDSNISIQNIAEASGYYNAKYFSSVFKKKEGMTPREYRERI